MHLLQLMSNSIADKLETAAFKIDINWLPTIALNQLFNYFLRLLKYSNIQITVTFVIAKYINSTYDLSLFTRIVMSPWHSFKSN